MFSRMPASPHGGEGKPFVSRNSPDWRIISTDGWGGRDMFHIAKDEEIKGGKVTDIYFARNSRAGVKKGS